VSFEASLAFVLSREGGLVDDPADPGGPTNHGITQRVYDAWQTSHGMPAEPVAAIPPDVVRSIYQQQYWDACKCNDLPDGDALVVFDTAVNLGVARTLALWSVSAGNRDALLWARLAHYDTLTRANPVLQKYVPGWLHRVLLLRAAAGAAI
jgi:Glycosyl hydrolase 108